MLYKYVESGLRTLLKPHSLSFSDISRRSPPVQRRAPAAVRRARLRGSTPNPAALHAPCALPGRRPTASSCGRAPQAGHVPRGTGSRPPLGSPPRAECHAPVGRTRPRDPVRLPHHAPVARASGPHGVSSGRCCSRGLRLPRCGSGRPVGRLAGPAAARTRASEAAAASWAMATRGSARATRAGCSGPASCTARGLQRGERCSAVAPLAPPRAFPPAPRAAPSERPYRGAQWAYSWPHTGKCSFNLRVRVHHEIWGFFLNAI